MAHISRSVKSTSPNSWGALALGAGALGCNGAPALEQTPAKTESCCGSSCWAQMLFRLTSFSVPAISINRSPPLPLGWPRPERRLESLRGDFTGPRGRRWADPGWYSNARAKNSDDPPPPSQSRRIPARLGAFCQTRLASNCHSCSPILPVTAMLNGWIRSTGGRNYQVAIYAWNPLVVVEFASSGHNDSLAIAAVIATLLITSAFRHCQRSRLRQGRSAKAFP